MFYATCVTAKGVNCTVDGSEIACVSKSLSTSSVMNVSSIASVSKILGSIKV